MTKTLRLKYDMRNKTGNGNPQSDRLRKRFIETMPCAAKRTYTALGHNYMWHADAHDKLEKYGFTIHVCIAALIGILWDSCCASSNNNPSVIAYYCKGAQWMLSHFAYRKFYDGYNAMRDQKFYASAYRTEHLCTTKKMKAGSAIYAK